MTHRTYLSVIIPAFNEERRIADTLGQIKKYLSQQSYKSEIIIVDDGSGDVTTEVIRVIDIYHAEFSQQEPSQVIKNIKNVGKGFSVACGMLKSKGDYVLLTDADMSTPIDEVEKLFAEMNKNVDLVMGSRHLLRDTKKPCVRKILSFALRIVCCLIGFRDVKDTQCGFKLYTSESAKKLAGMQKIYGFSFDIEHLYLAQKLGYKIVEKPVKWSYKEGSKVNPLFDGLRFLMDLVKLPFIHRKSFK